MERVGRQKLQVGAGAGAGILLLGALLGMVNYLAARHFRRGDWTSARVYSLSDKSIGIARGLKDDVRVTVMMVPLGGADDVYGHVRELLERLRRENPARLQVEYLDIDKQPDRATELAKLHNITTVDVREGVVIFEGGSGETKKVKHVTKSELVDLDFRESAQGGEPRVRAWKGEGAFASALLVVTEGKQTELCFVKGHGEAQIDGYEDDGLAQLGEELKRDNYKVRSIEDLDKHGVPKDCAVVIVAGPRRAWLPPEIKALETYLEGGGKAMLLLGPELERGLTAWIRTGLEDLAARFGIRLGQSLVLDLEASHPLEGPRTFAVTSYTGHPVVARMNDKVTYWSTARDVHAEPKEGLEVEELVRTSEQGWGETNLGALRGEADLGFDKATDVKGPVPVAAAAERKSSKTRLVVLGSLNFVLNYRLGSALRVADYNRDFFLAATAWLADKGELVAIGAKPPEHVKLTLTGDQLGRMFWVSLVLMPLAGALLGVLVWWRRRA